MSLDTATVRRIAALARIRLEEEEVGRMQVELNGILGWIEQLQAVDTEGVAPMAGGAPGTPPMAGGAPGIPSAPRTSAEGAATEGQPAMRMRADAVTDGGIPEKILANAPDPQAGAYFGVPKVVE